VNDGQHMTQDARPSGASVRQQVESARSGAGAVGTKGFDELTTVAEAPAIANAVNHATGKRVRDLPITVEKLL
jgi:CO/xanthine dehydrogenase Mo-binding subunit